MVPKMFEPLKFDCLMKHIVMKQSTGLNGDLKQEHTKTTKRTTMDPIIYIDGQYLKQIWVAVVI